VSYKLENWERDTSSGVIQWTTASADAVEDESTHWDIDINITGKAMFIGYDSYEMAYIYSKKDYLDFLQALREMARRLGWEGQEEK